MTDNRRFDREDLALFAMQLLSRKEEASIRAHIASSPEIQRELAEVHGEIAVYATTVDLHSPPALARDRLLAQIGRERKVRPPERPPESVPSIYGAGPGTVADDVHFRRDPGKRLLEDDPAEGSPTFERLLPWIGWAIAAALAVVSGNFYHQTQSMREGDDRIRAELTRRITDSAAAQQLLESLRDPAATRVTLNHSQQTASPQGKVIYAADSGTLLFVAGNLDPLDAHKIYELWLIPANGQPPTPSGLFRPDARGNASVILPQMQTGVLARAFGVTIEHEGGSQTPTMPTVLSGAAGS